MTPHCLAPILAICFLVPLHLKAVDWREDDPLPAAPPGKSHASPSSIPPTASDILSPPPLFPDLVEETIAPASAPEQPPLRSDRSQASPSNHAGSRYQPDQFGRIAPSTQTGHGGRRLQKLQRKLGLTPRQVAMIKPIVERAGRRLKALRADPTLVPSEKRYYARQIFAASFHQIRPLLTPRQLRKWRELREERRSASARV